MLYPQTNQFREAHDLNSGWLFIDDKNDRGIAEKWYAVPPQSCRPISVTASYNEQLPELMNYMGAVWYFKRFHVPVSWKNRRAVVRFGCANWNAEVWLNGGKLGSHSGGYSAFEFEMAGLKFGEENLLAVRTEMNLSRETTLQDGRSIGHWWGYGDKFPPTSADYFPWGGLFRGVSVYATPAEHYIADIRVETSIEGGDGIVGYRVVTQSDKDIRVSVDKYLCSGAKGKIRIPAARFWSPESPELYTLKVELIERGEIVDSYELEIGIREIKVAGDRVLLNGKPLHFQGVGRHDDAAITGAGLDTALLVRDFALMKWLGCNAFRAGHYLPADELLQLADRLGMLVFAEVPANAFYHGRLEKGQTAADLVPPEFGANHRRAVDEMADQCGNHASVVAWCVANEPNSGLPECADYLREIYNYTKAIDSSRPVIFTSCVGMDDKAQGIFDITALNIYYFADRAGGDWQDVQAMVNTLCEKMYERHGKPVLITEFGADCLAGEHSFPPVLMTEEFQKQHLECYLDVFETKPYICGTMIWCLADFRVPQHFGRQILNRKGLFTRDRQPKLAAGYINERWEKPLEKRSEWRAAGEAKVYIRRSEEDWR